MATKKVTKKEEAPVKVSKARVLNGVVTSDKMTDTIVVKVVRFVKHPKYGKFQKLAKKFKADDKGNTVKIGDKVSIVECSPISKDKHFKLVK
jgi:small subunit ribosomal protein S17